MLLSEQHSSKAELPLTPSKCMTGSAVPILSSNMYTADARTSGRLQSCTALCILVKALTQSKDCWVKARSTLVYASSRSSPSRARPSGVGCTAAAAAMPATGLQQLLLP